MSTVYSNWFSAAYVPTGTSQQTVTFTISDSNGAIEGAMIMLSNGQSAVTNASGNAVFYLGAGTYDVMVSADGYTTGTDSVTVSTSAVSKAITLTAA